MTVPAEVTTEPPASATVCLVSDELEVVVLPGKGADVHSFVDRATGVDVLWKSPWPWSDPARLPTDVPTAPLDEAGWLARYTGGWQLLLPNAGAPREVAGVRCGYHGEASVVPWTVSGCTDSQVLATVRLTSAPLHVTRHFEVDGPTLTVHTTVENLAATAVPVTWVEHPAFGRAFVDEHSVLETGARSVLSDADDPGAVLAPDVLSTPARAVTRDGGQVDLRQLPGPASGRKVFAALTDFDAAYYTIDSPTVGFGVRVEWDSAMFPHAWFWQECHATQDFPWFGDAFAVAVEPSNVIPGDPASTDPARGRAPLVAGHGTWSATLRMSVVRR